MTYVRRGVERSGGEGVDELVAIGGGGEATDVSGSPGRFSSAVKCLACKKDDRRARSRADTPPEFKSFASKKILMSGTFKPLF